jgi:hypothetical protein
MSRRNAVIIQATCAAVVFGLWQGSWFAGGFMLTALFCLDLIIRGDKE